MTAASLPPQFLQLNNFLFEAEKEDLLSYVIQQKSTFINTGSITNTSFYPEHRRSKALFSFPQMSAIVTRVRDIIGLEVFGQLQQVFPVSHIEAQLTAHQNGDYYRIHSDNGSPQTASRRITFVYYFYRDPKPFSGGELKIYNIEATSRGRCIKQSDFLLVEPKNNSIVFFNSSLLHEVLPVKSESSAFADSRFTINGWIRR